MCGEEKLRRKNREDNSERPREIGRAGGRRRNEGDERRPGSPMYRNGDGEPTCMEAAANKTHNLRVGKHLDYTQLEAWVTILLHGKGKL